MACDVVGPWLYGTVVWALGAVGGQSLGAPSKDFPEPAEGTAEPRESLSAACGVTVARCGDARVMKTDDTILFWGAADAMTAEATQNK